MTEEEIRAFKNTLRNYNFFKKEIDRLEKEIEYLYSIMGGSTAINYDGMRYAQKPGQFFVKMEKKDRLEYKKNSYEATITMCDNVLSKVSNKIRNCLIEIYINGSSFEKIAKKNDYSSSGLYSRIVNELKGVDND